MKKATRRDVLKSIGLVGLSSVAASQPLGRKLADLRLNPTSPERWNGEPFGRIAQEVQPARERPTVDADVAHTLRKDEIIRVQRVVEGQTVFNNNALWLETKYGYLYASFVQPVGYHPLNQPVSDLGAGRWAEMTVPYSDTYFDPDPTNEDRFTSRLYYGSTFRVVELVTGNDGQPWYKVEELYMSYYIPARHLKLIPDEDLSHLSPNVDPADKRVEINLNAQLLTAYEGDTPVFAQRISSGVTAHPTPTGVHYVVDKRISERMVGGIDEDKYNLPGVAFATYFNWDWVALHGCYWHNDYGRQRSHGCVNMPNTASRWLWRWTTPYPDDLGTMVVRPGHKLDGTKVVVTG